MPTTKLLNYPERERRFLQMYDVYQRQVYTYFKRRTNAASARDGAAETWLVAWRRFDDVPPSDRTLPWLYGVARRVLANQRRADLRFARLFDKMSGLNDVPDPTPETVVVRRSEDQMVLNAMHSLGFQDREVLRLAVWEELPHAEIAAVLGCKPHAVDQRLHRATRRLAKKLNVDSQRSAQSDSQRSAQRMTPDSTSRGGGR